MSSLHHSPVRVHSNPPALRLVNADDFEPIAEAEDSFAPNQAQEAYWTAFTLARAGEPGRPDRFAPTEIGMAWANGTYQGTKAREEAEAYDLGYELGVLTAMCEPPAGYRDHEAAAYRKGFAAGTAEFEEAVRREEAWLDSEREERMALAFGFTLTDSDIYPVGCMS